MSGRPGAVHHHVSGKAGVFRARVRRIVLPGGPGVPGWDEVRPLLDALT